MNKNTYTADRKYSELQNQLDGLKHAIANIQAGIDKGELGRILVEVNYFDEKQRRVLSNIRMLRESEQ